LNLFLDTSALVKFFHEEKGSQKVIELLSARENEIWVLELVKIEFTSALYRRYRNKEVQENELDEAIYHFEEELNSFHVEPLGQTILKEAENLIKCFGKTHGLRTLDALHLGAFHLISENDWYFVASDESLCQLVQNMNFHCINPLDE